MTELARLMLARAVAARTPRRLRHRVARALYDYRSDRLRGVDLVVPYLAENLSFLLNSKEFIGWNILFHGAYEHATNDLLRRLVQAGNVVIEAGANNGSETVLLGTLVGERGHVHAFEPVPHVARRLRANLALNDQLDRVTIYEQAIGEHAGSVELHLPPDDHPNQGIASKVQHELSTRLLEVPLVSLDDWAGKENVERVDLIKMDIQGAELDLLRGARELRKRSRPVIFTEAAASCSEMEELYDMLSENDYGVFLVDGQLNRRVQRDALPEGNWVAIPNDHPFWPR